MKPTWSEPGDVEADMRAALEHLRTIGARPLVSTVARLRLLEEFLNKHDHHSHHILGHFSGPDGEWVEHSPEEQARLRAEWLKGQARYWRGRYRAIVRELRAERAIGHSLVYRDAGPSVVYRDAVAE